MRIGEIANRTGASVRALRYYEEQGLLDSGRTAAGQREYGTDAVDRVLLLRRLYAAGLSSATIAAVLPCVDSPSATVAAETLSIMERERDRIEAQIDDLRSARDQLTYLIDAAERWRRVEFATTG